MDDVRAHAANEDDELEEAEQVAPDADRTSNMSQWNEVGARFVGRRSHGPVAVSRHGELGAVDERPDERRDVRLSTPRLGERYEQEDPRVLGHLDGRERYRYGYVTAYCSLGAGAA